MRCRFAGGSRVSMVSSWTPDKHIRPRTSRRLSKIRGQTASGWNKAVQRYGQWQCIHPAKIPVRDQWQCKQSAATAVRYHMQVHVPDRAQPLDDVIGSISATICGTMLGAYMCSTLALEPLSWQTPIYLLIAPKIHVALRQHRDVFRVFAHRSSSIGGYPRSLHQISKHHHAR